MDFTQPSVVMLIASGVVFLLWLVAMLWSVIFRRPTPPATSAFMDYIAARGVLRPLIPPEEDLVIWTTIGTVEPQVTPPPPAPVVAENKFITFCKKYGIVLAILLLLAAFYKPPTPNPPIPPDPPPPVPGQFSVLFIYESKNMPANQDDILNSTILDEYLKTHCLKDGTQPAYRWVDQNVEMDKMPVKWQKMWEKAKTEKRPCMVIDTGKEMYLSPWGNDVPETLIILQRYGGP